jgi:4-alpha-glucanotransferase
MDNSCRMNMPGTVDANWSWRLLPGQVTDELAEEVLIITKRFGRANWDALKAMEKAKKLAETTK